MCIFDSIYYTRFLSGLYWFPLEPSLSIGACVSRAGFRSTRFAFRVSRALVKRAQWSQENKHFHA